MTWVIAAPGFTLGELPQLSSSGACRSITVNFTTRLLVTGFLSLVFGERHFKKKCYSASCNWIFIVDDVDVCDIMTWKKCNKVTRNKNISKNLHIEMRPKPLYMAFPCAHPWQPVIQRPEICDVSKHHAIFQSESESAGFVCMILFVSYSAVSCFYVTCVSLECPYYSKWRANKIKTR